MHDCVHVEDKQSIRDWIKRHRKLAEIAYLDGHPLEVQQQLEQAGFTRVYLNNVYVWKELHDWCEKVIGTEHYTWFGNIFWFSDEQDALLFDLRWNNNEHHQIKA